MLRKNQDQGRFFMKTFCADCPTSIDEMKERIMAGDTKFLSQIQYFSQNIIGGANYWFQKKQEVHSWIAHHIKKGHGPPTYFITLSCAEYYWPDIMRLLIERLQFTDEKYDDDTTNIFHWVNNCSIVIQEYFQIRVEEFLNTVGKQILGIEHYWVRYEFAPSRGQIHAHLLAIAPKTTILKDYWNEMDNAEKQAEILSIWAKKKFGLSAELDEIIENFPIHPCSERYSEVKDKKHDKNCLLNCVQMHECNGYCIQEKIPKASKNKEVKKRRCKMGAGEEQTPGNYDTFGFELRNQATIVDDPRGFKVLQVKRNNNRVVQSSTDMLQAWRANCDIQLFLYDTDPEYLDEEEISHVTDYLVSYACKGNEKLTTQKEQMKSMILK